MARSESGGGDGHSGDKLAGYAALGCVAVGVGSVLIAVVACGSNNYQGGGLCLIAAAIAFGSLLMSLGR